MKPSGSGKLQSKTVAIDTETTGLNLRHGCQPFMVQAFDGEISHVWEWPVDPKTRRVQYPKRFPSDLLEILHSAETLVFHNAKFDIRALEVAGILKVTRKLWYRIEDTVCASHALRSTGPHNLKDLGLLYLDISDDDEKQLLDAVKLCRNFCRSRLPDWRIAKKGLPELPSANKPGQSLVHADYWLPKTLLNYLEKTDKRNPFFQNNFHWRDYCENYGTLDVIRTYYLWELFQQGLTEENLWRGYERKKSLLRITYEMENHGLRLRMPVFRRILQTHYAARNEFARKATQRSKIGNLDSAKQLGQYLYEQLKLPVIKAVKTGYSVDADTLRELTKYAEQKPHAARFLQDLLAYRNHKKTVEMLTGYDNLRIKNYLYPTFNVTGTRTTRLSSSDPNGQNMDKLLREIFGPQKGRTWFAIDYENIEMRIYAYASGERALIEAFERGESVHLIFCQVIHEDLYRECVREGVSFKEKYELTWYQWTKNGNFSIIYGASEDKADATYRKKGAYSLIQRRLPSVARFTQQKHAEVRERGYVTTLGGYRLYVPRDQPHKAVNFFVQGSAGEAMAIAMQRVDRYLSRLGPEYQMLMNVHDELLFSFPKTPGSYKVIRHVAKLMASSGDVLGLPLPVSITEYPVHWAKHGGVTISG